MSKGTRGPQKGQFTKVDFVVKANAAWGVDLPDWVLVLAEEARRTSLKPTALRIGLSPSLVSTVIANKYTGDLGHVEQRARGALMGSVVMCPVLGEIGRHYCLTEQRKPFSATSSVRSRLFRACRAGCPHSRIAKPE